MHIGISKQFLGFL